ncbi:hypothetical protein [Candidatus Poriferisodalis sp.]|uniref:hypothetical protein n=1 Tax=Candidatus Poriferisodalis sp. TaxID=3101277 RepID=UPI003B5CB893
MNAIEWTAVVVAGWFVLNLICTIANRSDKRIGRFVRIEQSGDVPTPSKQTRFHLPGDRDTKTSGKLTVHHPGWLRPAVRAVNNMRAQAPYLAALMALAWWIERMWS